MREGDTADVLRANATFYRAFSGGDYPAMRALWAEKAPVACQHPLSPTLFGRDAVLESWKLILREPPPVELRCDGAVAHLFGDMALVFGYEGNDELPVHLVATNAFVREGGEWRMVHHQAGPLGRTIARPRPQTMN
jgi:ketosteroid isomerase-like protein